MTSGAVFRIRVQTCQLRQCRVLLWLLVWSYTVLSSTDSYCQTTEKFAQKIFDSESGLNRSHINDIAIETQNGFIWLATEKGVIRYDRINFVEIGLRNSPLENSPCNSLSMFGNKLYVVFQNKGFAVINLNNYADVYSELGDIVSLSPINENDYVVLYQNGRLDLRRNTLSIASRVFPSKKTGKAQYHQGKLFLALPKIGMLTLDRNTLSTLDSTVIPVTNYLASFCPIGKRLIYYQDYTWYGWEDGQWYRSPAWFGLKGTEIITRGIKLSDGGFVYDRYQKNLILVKEDSSTMVFETDSVRNLEFYCIKSTGNTIFVGTNQGLLYISPYENNTGIINDNIRDNAEHVRIRRKIIELPSGELLLCGFPFNYKFKDGVFSRLSEQRFSTVDADRIGDTIYAATEGTGIMAISITTGLTRKITSKATLDELGFSFALSADPVTNTLLIGGNGKLIRYDLNNGNSVAFPLNTSTSQVRAIKKSAKWNRIIVGTSEGMIIMDTAFRIIKVLDDMDGISSPVNDALLDEKNNVFYVAHSQGVTFFEPSSITTTGVLAANEFKNPRCVSLTTDRDGTIWIGTYNGILAYDPITKKKIALDRNNGLINAEYNFKSARLLSDGKIIFGGLNCYDIIDPKNFRISGSIKKGLVTGFHIFSKNDTSFYGPVRDQQKITFNIDNDLLRLYLSSKGGNPEKNNSFQYSIDGGTWMSTGNEPYLDIFMLDPGDYTIRFRSLDEFGNEISYPSLKVNAVVPILESGFFMWSLVALAIIALLLYATSWSRHHKQMVSLRDKIAMDLHDEVGSVLTYSLYQAQRLEKNQKNSELQLNIREAINALRVYVKSIDQKPRYYVQLVDSIRDFIESNFPKKVFTVDLSESSSGNPLLSAELYRDIKLCVFELCTNILKHSNGNRIHIGIKESGGHITIAISDNGSLSENSSDFNSDGFGSKNLQKRSNRYGGSLKYSFDPLMSGTRAEIDFNSQHNKLKMTWKK